ncbi:unnamed protein product [Boreogadus saida]
MKTQCLGPGTTEGQPNLAFVRLSPCSANDEKSLHTLVLVEDSQRRGPLAPAGGTVAPLAPPDTLRCNRVREGAAEKPCQRPDARRTGMDGPLQHSEEGADVQVFSGRTASTVL